MSAKEIIGFAEGRREGPRVDGSEISPTRFNLVQLLEQAKAAEIARIGTIAERLLERFGADVAVGFLFCELLGRRPGEADCANHVERLRRLPSSIPEIIAALLNLAKAELPSPPAQRPAPNPPSQIS